MICEAAHIVELEISHYRALLKLGMADERRTAIKNLLAKAMEDQTLAKKLEQTTTGEIAGAETS